MRRAARADKNQPEVVEALRGVGCFVELLHAVGRGCADLLVGVPSRSAVHSFFRPAKWLLMEVKDGSKPPSERRLTPDQAEWHKTVRAMGLPVVIVESIEQALEAVK